MPVLTRPVVFITGAAGNLGTAVARAFLKSDARLVLLDRSAGRLDQLYPELTGSADHILAHSVDLTNPAQVEGAVKQTLEKFGQVDVLVNTVGGYRAGSSLEETRVEDWDFLFDINARSLFITCRAVLPAMRRVGVGRIINVSSRAALKGEAFASLYSASKSAALRLTESIAAEVATTEIRVNCVLPGVIDTPVNRQAMPGADHHGWVTPESIAGVILFLASEAARDIHGAAIPVYGRG
ncbi:MAG: SDR family NAD(P)-dependent oxidoreductase [Acidobacteriota bacterium]